MFTIEELMIVTAAILLGLLCIYAIFYAAFVYFYDRPQQRMDQDEWDARAAIGNDVNTTLNNGRG